MNRVHVVNYTLIKMMASCCPLYCVQTSTKRPRTLSKIAWKVSYIKITFISIFKRKTLHTRSSNNLEYIPNQKLDVCIWFRETFSMNGDNWLMMGSFHGDLNTEAPCYSKYRVIRSPCFKPRSAAQIASNRWANIG